MLSFDLSQGADTATPRYMNKASCLLRGKMPEDYAAYSYDTLELYSLVK